jgi:hypothetical protein
MKRKSFKSLKPSFRGPTSAPKRWLKSGARKKTVARLDPAASLAVAEQHFVVSPMSADWRHAPDHHRDPNVEYSLIPGIVRISVGLLAGTIAGCTGVRLDPVPTGFWKRLAPNCFVIISVLMLFTSCAKAPMTYSLQRWGTTSVVVPPNQKATNENSGLLVVELKNARRKATTTDCDIDGLVALRWRGKAVEINLRSESYFAERSEPTQSGGSMSGMYLDPLQDIATFHSQLLVLQARGCLSFTEAARMRRTVSEKFPLPPSIAYRYQLGVLCLVDHTHTAATDGLADKWLGTRHCAAHIMV